MALLTLLRKFEKPKILTTRLLKRAYSAWDVLVNPTLKGLRPTDLGNVRDCVDWGYNEATFPLCGTFSDGVGLSFHGDQIISET